MEKDTDNMLIVLGDVGINYYLNEEDKNYKEYLKKLKLKLFCVRGNHEERPENISTYKEVEMFGGKVLIEEEYPNLIFAKDRDNYNIDGKKILVIGGAYSVDKQYRLLHGYKWFKDEQLTKEEMNTILDKVKGKHFEIVRDVYSQNEVMKEEVKCPKCNSKNISVLKGDGFGIIGADYIAIIFNDCKKIYGFNDVKYKTNCPKEL